MRILNSCVVLAIFDLANLVARQPASPAAHCAPVLVIDKASVQPDIFAVKNCFVIALIVVSSDILDWSADSLYSVQ